MAFCLTQRHCLAGPGMGTDSGQPLVMTYLNGLGCPLTGRANALNTLVRP